MKELLQEAAKIQARAHDHLMELSAKLPMQYFGLVDSGIIQDLGNIMGRITAALASPEPDAMELVDQLAAIINSPFDTVENRKEKAAALIADYGRRVPRAISDIAGKLEEAIDSEDWNEAKSALNDLWDLRDDGYKVEG
jgi:hypothetical protein